MSQYAEYILGKNLSASDLYIQVEEDLKKEGGAYRNKEGSLKKIDEYIKGMRDLYLDKMKGLLTDADFADLSQNFSNEKTHLQTLISNIDKEITAVDERIAAGDNRKELIEQYINVDHLTREMVIAFIDYIRVGKRIKGTKDIPIEIHWNF